MKKGRLLTLARYLEKQVPEENFYMGDWWKTSKKKSCGTSGCAMGYACQIPAFKEAGLKRRVCMEGRWTTYYDIVFEGTADFEAAASFFDIRWLDAHSLFTMRGLGETPKQVATRIREFVKIHV